MKLKQKNLIRRNFTMVELLTVCAIIAILAGIGAGGYALAQTKIKEAKTQSLIARITTALEACKVKHGFYPPTDANGFLLLDLGFGEAADNTPKKKFFDDYANMVEFENLKKSSRKVNGFLVILDAYGYPLYYSAPGRVNTETFDLISCGADGQIGTTSTPLWGNYKPYAASGATIANQNTLSKFDIKNSDDLGNK